MRPRQERVSDCAPAIFGCHCSAEGESQRLARRPGSVRHKTILRTVPLLAINLTNRQRIKEERWHQNDEVIKRKLPSLTRIGEAILTARQTPLAGNSLGSALTLKLQQNEAKDQHTICLFSWSKRALEQWPVESACAPDFFEPSCWARQESWALPCSALVKPLLSSENEKSNRIAVSSRWMLIWPLPQEDSKLMAMTCLRNPAGGKSESTLRAQRGLQFTNGKRLGKVMEVSTKFSSETCIV